jgi:hypothetical protein
MVGLPKTFEKVSPLNSLKMIMELQFTPTADSMSGGQPQALTLGWFAVPTFKMTTASGEPVLNSGNFKIPIHPGAFMPNFLNNFDADLEKQKLDPDVSGKPTIFFRIRHASEKTEALAWDPDTSQHLYKYLWEAQEDAVSGDTMKQQQVQQVQQQQVQQVQQQQQPPQQQQQQQQQVQEQQEPDQQQEGQRQPLELDPLDIPDQPPSLNQAPSADVDPELQSATHNIAIQIHKLDVLPHANMDTKPNMGVAVEAM